MNRTSSSDSSVLIVAPAWVGDMITMHALVLELERQGNSCVDIVAPPWSMPVARLMPQVARIEPLEVVHGQLGLGVRRRLGVGLRARNYQRAIVLPNSFKSALVPWWANIPRRVGWRGEMRYGLLTDIHHERYKPKLVVKTYVALAHAPGAQFDFQPPFLRVPALRIDAFCARHGLDRSAGWIALCHGAAKQHKRWPPAKFGALASRLVRAGRRVVLLGSKDDQNAVEAIKDAAQVPADALLDLTGELDLLDAAAALSVCAVAVANDSGLMHMAAGLQVPVVGLYGPTSPATNPPLSETAQVVTASLEGLAVMEDIAVEKVFDKVEKALALPVTD